MSYKTKAKIQKVIFNVFTMVGFMACGGFIGLVLGSIEKHSGKILSLPMMILSIFLALAALYVAYYLQICLHEVGHMVFGLMTGYRFSSIRFGSFMIIKQDGKLKIKKYQLGGTGGQAIMLPPVGDKYDYPVFWYNVGGLVVNGILCVISLAVWWLFGGNLYVKLGAICFLLIGLTVFVTNGLPFTEIGTDGANVIILLKNRNARLAFRNSLEVVKYLGDGVAMSDIPAELFAYDKSMGLENPLIVAQAANHFSYLVVQHKFDEAYEIGEYILKNAASINQIHELDLLAEMIYIRLIAKKDTEGAKEAFKKDEKRMKLIASLLSYQRSIYAYYVLGDVNEKKAQECKKTFEKLAKHYPYPKDAEAERELMLLADEVKNKEKDNEEA